MTRPGRAKWISAPTFIVMHNSYLVRSDSPLQKTADVDRAGVTVAAIKGQSQQLFVSRSLKNARVQVLDTMPPQPELESILLGKSVDAFAINRQRGLGRAVGLGRQAASAR